jgi:hypothetical protein
MASRTLSRSLFRALPKTRSAQTCTCGARLLPLQNTRPARQYGSTSTRRPQLRTMDSIRNLGPSTSRRTLFIQTEETPNVDVCAATYAAVLMPTMYANKIHRPSSSSQISEFYRRTSRLRSLNICPPDQPSRRLIHLRSPHSYSTLTA